MTDEQLHQLASAYAMFRYQEHHKATDVKDGNNEYNEAKAVKLWYDAIVKVFTEKDQ